MLQPVSGVTLCIRLFCFIYYCQRNLIVQTIQPVSGVRYTLEYEIHETLIYFMVWGLKQLSDTTNTLSHTLSLEGLRISFEY